MNKQLLILTFLCSQAAISLAGGYKNVTDSDTTKFKPSVQVGGFLQVQGVTTQDRPMSPALDQSREWARQVQIARARFMVGGSISPKTSFFMQTELPAPVGFVSGTGTKNMQRVAPILLDAQIEHTFNRYVSLITGMQLVGINRNGLQSPVTLMGLDFGWYQYPYNVVEGQALQNNFGRDVGVNARGFLANDRLEWRAGVFRGRGVSQYSPFRTVVRVNYNFLDREKGFYYSGTTLGKQKIFSIGGGLDKQGTYTAMALDAFLDLPLGPGSVTMQSSYMHLTGGNSADGKSFTPLVPNQSIYFAELGYYFPQVKLQPYVKYEAQQMDITSAQYAVNNDRIAAGLPVFGTEKDMSDFNTLTSNSRIGGGLNYYVNEFNFHVKLQYEKIFYGRFDGLGGTQTKSGGEVKLQFTYFIFQ